MKTLNEEARQKIKFASNLISKAFQKKKDVYYVHSLVWVAVVRTLNIYSVEFHQSKVNACAGSIFDLLQPDSHCRTFT